MTTLTGFCQCGCGHPTSIAKRTRRGAGWIKGQPLRFLRGHGGSRTGRIATPATNRIDSRIEIRSANECWSWTGSTNPDGYGIVSENGSRRVAHRVAYERVYGVIPDGLVVRHRCDNPPCCNPSHLVVGTHADNSKDMVERGRSAKGIAHPGARLTDEEVRSIRSLHSKGQGVKSLANTFGVNSGTVWFIVNGHHWKHVGDAS